MRHISLRSKIHLCLLAAALLIGGSRYFYFISTNQYIDTALHIQQTQRVLAQLETVISLAKDAETGERGYIITRQERFLEPFELALRNLNREMEDLEAMTATLPFYPSRVQKLENLVQKQISVLTANVVRVRSGRYREAADNVAAGEGKRVLDAIRQLVGEMQSHEKRQLAGLLGELELRARLNNQVNVASVAILATIFLLGMYTILRDLKRRERLERQLKANNGHLEELSAYQQILLSRLHEAQEIARVGSFTLDGATNTFTGSPELYRIYGWNPEHTGSPSDLSLFFDRLHPDDQEKVRAAVQTSLENLAPYQLEYRVVLPDGKEKNILVRGKAVRTDGRVYLQGTALDNTEQKLAEAELRASEARFRALLESAPDAMIITNEKSRIQLVNAQTERLFGYSKADLIGQPVEILMPRNQAEQHRQHRVAYAETPKIRSMGVGLDLKGVRKDGTEFPVEISLSPIRTGEGLLVAAAIRDVSERKRYEMRLETLNQELLAANEELNATNEELAANVEELAAAGEKIQEYSVALEQNNQQLELTVGQLQQANGDLESFSYSISHDLKSPLRSVISFGGILKDEYGDRLDGEGNRLLGIVIRNARFMNELIEALLQFARLGKTAVRKEDVNMDKMVRTLAGEMLDGQHPAPALSLAPLGVARADYQLIRQVWQNLLSNAIRFSAGKADPQISVGYQSREGEDLYYVQDNGIGFNPVYAHEMFGVFKRLHTAEGISGTGVGLAICQRIVAGHGGRIWAEGAVGQGATFYFAIPRQEGRPAEREYGDRTAAIPNNE